MGFFVWVFLFGCFCSSLLLWDFGWGFWFGICFFLKVIVLSVPTSYSSILFIPPGKKNKKGFGMYKSHRIHMSFY